MTANKISINKDRLKFLLDLYGLSEENFLNKVNSMGKSKISLKKEDLFSDKVKISSLKKVDKIFERGLTYYANPEQPLKDKNASIFFRKKNFSTPLNIEEKKIINLIEEKKFFIQNIADSANIEFSREFDNYSSDDSAEEVALIIREKFDEVEKQLVEDGLIFRKKDDHSFLKNLMRIIEQFGIVIFEHVDRKRVEEKKINFDGFFMEPNIIFLKSQKYRKKEIFTLMHEFAHYLLNVEEIESNPTIIQNSSEIEQWCHNFAYYFLISNHRSTIENLPKCEPANDYNGGAIRIISEKTHLSSMAIYTHLKISNKLTSENYNLILNRIREAMKNTEEEERNKILQAREMAKELGEEPPFVSSRKPIISNLLKEIIRVNYFNGEIREVDISYLLNIKKDKVGKINEVIYS